MIDAARQILLDGLAGNEFFQGGAVLGLLGIAAAWGRNVPAAALRLLKRRFVVEMDVQQGYAFDALVHWMATHPYARRTRRRTAFARRAGGRRAAPVARFDGDEDEGAYEMVVSPAPGTHVVSYRGWPVLINRGREKESKDGLFVGFYESFTLQTVGPRSMLDGLLREALDRLRESEGTGPKVFVYDGYVGWDSSGPARRPRPLESVVLPKGVMPALAADMEWFLGAGDWYASVGVPHRRGYLLHGPPGTGKTSACSALASYFGLDVAVASLNSGSLDDTKLALLFQKSPQRSIVLLEDVDCLYNPDRTAKDEAGKVTLSGLLNALDGAAAQEGRAFFMTTNHRDRLDPALLRPGRADVEVEFGLADASQLARMYLRFFPAAPTGWAAAFADAVGGGKRTPAEVQQWLMLNRGDARAASEWRR